MGLLHCAKTRLLGIGWVRRLRNLLARAADWALHRLNRDYNARTFTRIYLTGKWVGIGDSVSGEGSTLEATRSIRRELPGVVRNLGIRSLVDAPCGDFLWMRDIVGCFDRYVGMDIVPALVRANSARFSTDRVRFQLGDITSDALPAADAVLCRDCLIHLSTPLIWSALRNLRRSGYRYIMLTHHTAASEYREIVTGDWRPINWRLPPFCFPEPAQTIAESRPDGAVVAVWDASRLPL